MAVSPEPAQPADNPPGGSRIAGWQIWGLPEPLRGYLLAISALSLAAAAAAAAVTTWKLSSGLLFAALLACGVLSVESNRTVKEIHGALSRDLQTVWYLAIAVSLPPAYAFAAPLLLAAYKLWRMPRMIVYRRVFSNATLSLAYGCASLAFHAIPASIAGPEPGTGMHAATWTGAVVACGILGWLINHLLLLAAIRLSDPSAGIRELFGTRESVAADLVELSLAASVSLMVTISPVLMVVALPAVVMYRHYLMRAQLTSHARMDPNTGLLNTVTWQREATAECAAAARTQAPLALAMVNIDPLGDTALGQPLRDQLRRDIAVMLREQLPGQDLIGRFSDEDFVILLPHTGPAEARRLSERLRDRIAAEPIAIESGNQAGYVFRPTVSIGVAALSPTRPALIQLVATAALALDQARSTGSNKVRVITDSADSEILSLARRAPAQPAVTSRQWPAVPGTWPRFRQELRGSVPEQNSARTPAAAVRLMIPRHPAAG